MVKVFYDNFCMIDLRLVWIRCATPKRRNTNTGSSGKINSVLKISTRSIVGVKVYVNDPNTTTMKEINREYDHKSEANVNGDNNGGTVKGTELPTD